MEPGQLAAKLKDLFPSDRVFVDEATLVEYASDFTEAPARRPDAVVKAQSREEIVELVKFANQNGIPVVPAVARSNLGGLTIPCKGGIILDLTLMRNVLEVNEDEMYAVIEPGVTFGDIRAYLDEHHPTLRFGYPLSPPYTSVCANCLCDGLANLSMRHGAMSEWVNGMEVVLPTGEVLVTGAGAISPCWFGRAPMPGLGSLFISWQGTTGVVTKMAIQLWPNLPHRQRMFVLSKDRRSAFMLMRRYARTMLFDDIGGMTWPTGKMLFGVKRPGPKDPDEPGAFVYLDFSGNEPEEIRFKTEMVKKVLDSVRAEGGQVEEPIEMDDIIQINPRFEKFAEFPTTLDFLVDHGGGGLTWVGTYGPTAMWDEGADKGEEIMLRHGFAPVMVLRPMKGGHFSVLRFIMIFDKDNEDEVDRAGKCNRELGDMVLDLGYVIYKTPEWAVDKLAERINPNTFALMKRIKKLLDPNGIMNPGKWNLE